MLVPWTGMDLSQPALESKVLTTGHQGSFPYFIFFIHKQTNKQTKNKTNKQKTLLKEGLNNVNTRPPYLCPEKPLYRPRSNSWNQAGNNS